MVRPEFFQRVAWNTNRWKRPSGDVARLEHNSFGADSGFAHEEWLFDFERLIDGWRYGFLQGLHPEKLRVVGPGDLIDVVLWAIDDQKRRRWVARIERCEIISSAEEQQAIATFTSKGWLADMKRDVREVGGRGHDNLWLDCRFRPRDVHDLGLAEVTDPAVLRLKRYNLVSAAAREPGSPPPEWKIRRRAGGPASTRKRQRKAIGAIDYDPIEAAMQAEIAKLLRRQYGYDAVRLEEDSVYVKVITPEGCLLLELKSHLDPHRAIRQAVGQLLDYSHRARMRNETVAELIVVGRTAGSSRSDAFITYLREDLQLPIRYLAYEEGRLDL